MTVIDQDRDDSHSFSSVNSHEALMEMLGFSGQEIDEDTLLNAPEENSTNSCTFIQVPSNCSKYHLDPSDCFAISIDSICPLEDCRALINMASNRFQYITEAAHISPSGETFMVRIQNPNPHKLSVIDTSHDPSDLILNSKDAETLILDKLYERIENILLGHPRYTKFIQRKNCGPIRGLNPRMRILKYDACDNDRFEPHFDATTAVRFANGQYKQSLITVLLYLNDGGGVDFHGGETMYLSHSVSGTETVKNTKIIAKVIPKAGKIRSTIFI